MTFTDPPGTDENGILARLKSGTMAHHHSIENAIPILSSSLTAESYVEILKRLYGFHKAFEDSLAHHPTLIDLVPDLDLRKKTALLKADLNFYGLEDNALRALPQLPEAPVGESVFEALGSLYVMEGSTLGGQLISQHLLIRFGMTATTGAAYYNAYGNHTGKMWQAFKAFLQAHVRRESEIHLAVRGAQNTFESLQNWMS